MKKVNLIIIVALAIFLLLSFFSIPKSSLFSPSLKNLKPIEIGVLYKYCTTDAQCELNQKCYKNSCRNKVCVDSDGGIVPEIFGTVSVSLEGNPSNPIYYPDVCAGSLNIKEFYCNENNNPSIQEILCPGVCSNGVCVPAICGDGIISQNEQCDSNNLDGKTCADFGKDSGVLSCDANCQFDISGCFNSQSECENNSVPNSHSGYSRISLLGEILKFNASHSSDSDGEIVSYFWDFGDGTTSSEISPTHIYSQPGFYTASLTVTDNCQALNTAFFNVSVQNGNKGFIVEELLWVNRYGEELWRLIDTENEEIECGLNVSFRFNPAYNWEINEPVLWVWNFGDGYTSSEVNPKHKYPTCSRRRNLILDIYDANYNSAQYNSYVNISRGFVLYSVGQPIENAPQLFHPFSFILINSKAWQLSADTSFMLGVTKIYPNGTLGNTTIAAELASYAWDLSTSRNHILSSDSSNIFLAGGQYGVQIRLADPNNCILRSSISSSEIENNPANSVAYLNSSNSKVLYVGSGNYIYTFDVANPDNPQLIGQRISVPNGSNNLFAIPEKSVLIAGGYYSTIYFFNCTNPASPQLITSLNLSHGGVMRFYLDSDLLVVRAEGKIFLIDIEKINSPRIINSFVPLENFGFIDNSRYYGVGFAMEHYQLYKYDIANAENSNQYLMQAKGTSFIAPGTSFIHFFPEINKSIVYIGDRMIPLTAYDVDHREREFSRI